MEIRDLKLDDLVLDPSLNLRDRLDDDIVGRYVEGWARMPPVTVFDVDGNLLLADGFHRHAAAVTLNKKVIVAEVREGAFADAMDFAAGANLLHGLPLSRAERRRAIEVKLRLHHDRSDRHLSDELGVSRDTIAKIRRQLAESGQIPAGNARIGADGKLYPATLAKDPNEHLPRGSAGQDDPRDRGRSESDAAPWDDATAPMPPVNQPPPGMPPWEGIADLKTIAQGPPVHVAAPTIDEMLLLMARQIQEVATWAEAEGFAITYRTAGTNSRKLFQAAVLRLGSVADRLQSA